MFFLYLWWQKEKNQKKKQKENFTFSHTQLFDQHLDSLSDTLREEVLKDLRLFNSFKSSNYGVIIKFLEENNYRRFPLDNIEQAYVKNGNRIICAYKIRMDWRKERGKRQATLGSSFFCQKSLTFKKNSKSSLLFSFLIFFWTPIIQKKNLKNIYHCIACSIFYLKHNLFFYNFL